MDVLLGLQWGDEGKGKIVDYLSPKYDIVARFQGGPNAGHTLEFDGRKHVLHQIPSGIFREEKQNVIGNGVVLDPAILMREIREVESYGHQVNQNLFISKKAHLILPTHRLLDAAFEEKKGEKKIGSTLKGIGPVYQDKIGRNGLRIGDLVSSNFEQKYKQIVEWHRFLLDSLQFDYNLQELEEPFFTAIQQVRQLNFIDSEYFLHHAIRDQKKIIAEGAQGTLLDIDFGSYPFVTSSNTSVAGACTGLGIPPSSIQNVLGIFKAYCTRVGSGPFPTELFGEEGEMLRRTGREFGATTGRPRRCGWLDLPALKYSVWINGVSSLFMMKADVLNEVEDIQVCTHYELENGEVTDQLPYDITTARIKPVLKSFKGWQVDLKDIQKYSDLPLDLKEYIEYIEGYLQVPINLISTGPDRRSTIIK